MCFVKDNTFPFKLEKPFKVFAENFIVDDNPISPFNNTGRGREGTGTYDDRFGYGKHKFDFTNPIPFDRGGANYEIGTLRLRLSHRDDGLSGFAESHIVSEQCPATPQ